MYDLEIIVPMETNLTTRMVDFRKWGLLNTKNHKIKLFCMASKGNDFSPYLEGWPEGIDVEWIETPYNQVAQRIHHYYNVIAKPDTARWYFRIDEDSINDIDGLMTNLDTLYDHERDYHMSGTLLNHDENPIEKEIVSSLGFGFWYGTGMAIPHDYEMSVTSNAAMKKILNNSNCKKYFNRRTQIAGGYGDHGLSLCARMEKIHTLSAKFMYVNGDLIRFSLFGGPYNHIHHVDRNKCPALNWLESIKLMDKSQNLEDKYFIWTVKKENKNKLVKFRENHKLTEIDSRLNHLRTSGLWAFTPQNNLSLFLDRITPFEVPKIGDLHYENEEHLFKEADVPQIIKVFKPFV